MNTHPQFGMIHDIAASLRDMLGDDFDEQTFLDTLDGETDAMDIADRLLDGVFDADALADAIKTQEADLKARRQRVESRSDAYRAQILTLLNAIDVKKLERPRATVSKRAGSMSVRIVDEASVPSQLCTVKTITSPDKAAIKAALEAGEAVPGCELARGDDGITVRVK